MSIKVLETSIFEWLTGKKPPLKHSAPKPPAPERSNVHLVQIGNGVISVRIRNDA